jgi:hypothetical protein
MSAQFIHEDELSPKSSAVSAHQQMKANKQALLIGQIPIHRLGDFM